MSRVPSITLMTNKQQQVQVKEHLHTPVQQRQHHNSKRTGLLSQKKRYPCADAADLACNKFGRTLSFRSFLTLNEEREMPLVPSAFYRLAAPEVDEVFSPKDFKLTGAMTRTARELLLAELGSKLRRDIVTFGFDAYPIVASPPLVFEYRQKLGQDRMVRICRIVSLGASTKDLRFLVMDVNANALLELGDAQTFKDEVNTYDSFKQVLRQTKEMYELVQAGDTEPFVFQFTTSDGTDEEILVNMDGSEDEPEAPDVFYALHVVPHLSSILAKDEGKR